MYNEDLYKIIDNAVQKEVMERTEIENAVVSTLISFSQSLIGNEISIEIKEDNPNFSYFEKIVNNPNYLEYFENEYSLYLKSNTIQTHLYAPYCRFVWKFKEYYDKNNSNYQKKLKL